MIGPLCEAVKSRRLGDAFVVPFRREKKKSNYKFPFAESELTEIVKVDMAKSVTQEMACEIARIAQTRVVEVERVSFACGPVTLKMVKTTLGLGWLLNDKVLFSSDDCHQVAKAFYFNIKTSADPESNNFKVRFGGTDTIVWSVERHKAGSNLRESLSDLAYLLKTPPIIID